MWVLVGVLGWALALVLVVLLFCKPGERPDFPPNDDKRGTA